MSKIIETHLYDHKSINNFHEAHTIKYLPKILIPITVNEIKEEKNIQSHLYQD